MLKHVRRMCLPLSRTFGNGFILSNAGIVNENLSTSIHITSNVFYHKLPCDFIRRNYCKKSDSQPIVNYVGPEGDSRGHLLQRKLQEEAQDQLNHLLSNDPETLKLYKILQLEMDILVQTGERVPEILKPTEWLQMLNIPTRSGRKKYCQFLWKNEIKRKRIKLKKKESHELHKALMKERDDRDDDAVSDTTYSLGFNSLYPRIYKTTISFSLNQRLQNVLMFGEKLVIDCGFESHMDSKESSSCAKQIMYSFVENRLHKDPFDLYLCNMNMSGPLMTRLLSFIPTILDPEFPMHITSKSYFEFFPKERLVYLTPHTSNVLEEYDPDDVYIIGAIVDKRCSKPLTLAKAKEENIRMVKFPLDQHLGWRPGSGKSLTINQCVNIMSDLKLTRNWPHALQKVPQRKVFTEWNHQPCGSDHFCPNFSKGFDTPQYINNFEPAFESAQPTQIPDFTYFNRQIKRNKARK